jgi:hypothetical protein
MSFGTGPWGTTGVGVPVAELPSEPRTTFSSSRSIVFETMRYEQNEDGGFKPMSDTLQRVLLAIAFGVKEPKLITPQALRQVENAIRVALEPLTRPPRPAIKLLRVEALDDGKQTTTKIIEFFDYATNTTQSVPTN